MLMSRDSIALALACALMAACTPTPEWTRERQASVTERTFASASAAATVSAAEASLRRAFGRSVSFEYRDDGFVARRFANDFFLIGGTQATYTFDFMAKPSAGTASARLLIYSDTTTITTLGPIAGGASLWHQEGADALFFLRLESILRNQPDLWLTCPEARQSAKLPSFGFEPICLGTGDDRAAR